MKPTKTHSSGNKPSWKGFKDFVGVFFLAVFLLICIFGVLYLFTILIENPVSLAIICLTIFLIWAWSNR